MRVPTRSAGTRSGVNWMRLKSPLMACASVLMAIVLASPGTPSTSMWPRASSATSMRSNRWSWPTMTFLTSYSTRSMGSLGAACWPGSVAVDGPPLSGWVTRDLLSVGRQAEAASGDVDGHGQADAGEDVVGGG